jgi:predicted protein tyrosine phosphatase
MESLNPKTQEQIKKMSTEYLYVKLAKAGYDEEAIVKMSREQLIAAWAELVAAGKDKPHAPALVHADPTLEQKRLEFEMLKYREQVEREEKLRKLRGTNCKGGQATRRTAAKGGKVAHGAGTFARGTTAKGGKGTRGTA